ncbi:MAG: hypothetical protein CR964_00020 [Rhodobacterales bacterium]|nr:MAG: hypothetical protein CR964_00020 [Rhodobacterales bacterium]
MNRKLLLAALAVILLALAGLWALRAPSATPWQETQAEISFVERMDDGTYVYSLTYRPTGPDGRALEPISQHAFGVKQAPVLGQKIDMRYMREEPVIFELLGKIQWQAGSE